MRVKTRVATCITVLCLAVCSLCSVVFAQSAKAESGTWDTSVDFTADTSVLTDFDSYYWYLDPNNPKFCNPSNPAGNGWYQGRYDHSDVWAFTDKGLVNKTNLSPLDNRADWQNWASLLTKEKYQYFTMETTLCFSPAKFDDGNSIYGGYGGLQFNIDEPLQAAPYIGGVAVYINPYDGTLIYRKNGSDAEAADKSAYDPEVYGGAAYDRTARQTLKIEVTGAGIKAFVNDVLRLDIARTDCVSGRVGLEGIGVDCFFEGLVITPASGEAKTYDFIDAAAYAGFDAYFYQWDSKYGVNAWDQVSMPASRLWGRTDKGMSRLTAADKLGWMQKEGSDDWAWLDKNNLNSLIYNGSRYQYFEAESVVHFNSEAVTGMGGLQFNVVSEVSPVYWTAGMAAYIDSADGSVKLRSHLGADANGEMRAQSAYSPDDYDGAAFEKTADHILGVKTNAETVIVTVDGVERIRYRLDTIAGYALSFGRVGLYADSRTSFFKDFKIKVLDGEGNPAVAVESLALGEISEPKTGGTYDLGLTIEPANATRECDFVYDRDKAFIANGRITFLEAGSVTVTATSVFNAAKTATKTYTVDEASDAMLFYDLSKQADTEKTTPYFLGSSSLSAVAGVPEALSKHWTVGEKGITRKAADGEETLSLDGNYGMLYLPGIYKDFEMSFTVDDNNVALGWAGLMFGKETYGSSHYSNGNGVNIPIQFSGYSCNGAQIGPASEAGNEQGNYPAYIRGGINLVRVRVFGTRFQLYFNDMAAPVIDKTVAASKEGFLALYANLQDNPTGATFGKVFLNVLNEQGERVDYVPSDTIDWSGAITTGEVETALKLNASTDGTQKFVNYVSDNPEVVEIVNGNTAVFRKTGTAAVTAYNADGAAEVTKTFTVVERKVEGALSYAFDDGEALEKLGAYYQEGEAAGTAVPETLDAHWTIEGDTATRVNDLGGEVSVSWAELYLDRTFESFEITYQLKAGIDAAGWAGVMFGKTGRNSSFFYDGDGAYVSLSDTVATFWGQTVGDHADAGNSALATNYDPNGWNTISVKVFGESGATDSRTVQLYVNDMTVPVIENVKAVAPKDGYVCLFTTGAAAAVRDMNVRYLDKTGAVIPYVAVTGISIANKTDVVAVDSRLTVDVRITPANATISQLIYDSSDKTVAVVTAGTISFIGEGEVTITVASKDNPALTDTMTVTARHYVSSLAIGNKIQAAVVGDTVTLQVTVGPEHAFEKGVRYSSGDETIATVSEEGVVTFLSAGTVTITAAAKDGSGVSDSMTVTVTEPDKGCGCGSFLAGGSIAFTIVAFAALLAFAAVLAARKKRRSE